MTKVDNNIPIPGINTKKSKYDFLILEGCVVEDDMSSWVLDSRATNHVCSSMQILESSRELADGEVTMRVEVEHWFQQEQREKSI